MKSKEADRTIGEARYNEYRTALLGGDRAACASIVKDLDASGVGLKDIYLHLFQRSLYEVGELWERQKISVAVEHLATAITERMLTIVQPQAFGGLARNRSIIIASVADEHHQVGARMIADLCELRGWRGYFLGAGTPLPDLLGLIEEKKPDLLGMSLSIYFNLPALLRTLDAVTAAHPDLHILAGGQAFRWGGLTAIEKYPNVAYISSFEELEKRMAAYE